jgi:hypothetical protein
MDALKSAVCAPLSLSLVHTPAPRQPAKLRIPATKDGLHRRSARVAVQGKRRVSNPETQAQNMLMKKWKITSEVHSPDAEALQAYHELYSSLVGSSKGKAIRALFRACPDAVVDPLGVVPWRPCPVDVVQMVFPWIVQPS